MQSKTEAFFLNQLAKFYLGCLHLYDRTLPCASVTVPLTSIDNRYCLLRALVVLNITECILIKRMVEANDFFLAT